LVEVEGKALTERTGHRPHEMTGKEMLLGPRVDAERLRNSGIGSAVRYIFDRKET